MASQPRPPGHMSQSMQPRPRLPRKPTLRIPERFQDGDDAHQDVMAPRTKKEQYMNQSFISMIANVGSGPSFQPYIHPDSTTNETRPTTFNRRLNSPHDTPRRSTQSQTLPERVTSNASSIHKKGASRLKHLTSVNESMSTSQILTRPSTLPETTDSLTRTDTTVHTFEEALPYTEQIHSPPRTATPPVDSTEIRGIGLSDKVADIFAFNHTENVVAEYPCWLLQNVMLQGHMYITQYHLCYYAYLPKKSSTTIKSGHLSKRGRQNPKYNRYWFTLRSDVLSYYSDAFDLYFPRGNINLRLATSAQLTASSTIEDKRGFSIDTGHETYHFKAESSTNAREWVRQLQKVIFRSHNDGDSVKISIPINNILAIDEDNPLVDAVNTLRIRVVDNNETFAIDEYFFSFLGSGKAAMALIRAATDNSTSLDKNILPTSTRADDSEEAILEAEADSFIGQEVNASSAELPSRDGTISSSDEASVSGSQILEGSGVFREPTIRSKSSIDRDLMTMSNASNQKSRHHNDSRSVILKMEEDDELPRSPSTSSSFQQYLGGVPLQKVSGMANMVKDRSQQMRSLLSSNSRIYTEKVTSMWAGKRIHYDAAEAIAPDDMNDDGQHVGKSLEDGNRFRAYFALAESERLQASYHGYLNRVIPVFGKIYVGTRKLCFRSLIPGFRTKMILPIKDIETVVKEKGFRFGYSGLVVVVRGHEELFFEFSRADARDDLDITLLQSLETVKDLGETRILSQEERLEVEAVKVEHELLERARLNKPKNEGSIMESKLLEAGEEAPPIMFDDPLASIINFKPSKPLRVTCLTIGSRGDVQPYIALCKGLLADGHKPRIVTHAEFEPWIIGHGIEFTPVAGDPAEIMQLCVENDMFTVAFYREASSKFRGWLDSLLGSSWKACQDSDLLIESPSAMAGIHIAEALQIPYFRAFTMPWTQTRAYPHAFVVPNQKLGGNYNAFTYVMFHNFFWQSTAGQINRWREKTLGLPKTSLDKLQINKVPFLYNFSPSVVAPPLDFNQWIHITGYWFLDEGQNYEPPKDLAEFIQQARKDGKKIVYVGFGSITISDPAALTKTVVDSVVKADVRCILSKGWSERMEKRDKSIPEATLPSCIHQIKSAPHDWLFQQVDAAVHHGGAGTTGASLRAGVPTIVKPFFGDQFFFGGRVQDLGVGKCLKVMNTSVFARALWEVTNSERMIVKARCLGEQIRNENGVDKAIQTMYRDMEYAKSLVKRRRNTDEETLETTTDSWMLVDEEQNEDEGGEEDIDAAGLTNSGSSKKPSTLDGSREDGQMSSAQDESDTSEN